MRTYQPDTADYTGQQRMALKIRASNLIQGVVQTFPALAAAKVPVWNGSTWVTQATSNSAWLFYWFAKGKTIGTRQACDGLLPDSRIELESIKEWEILERKMKRHRIVCERPWQLMSHWPRPII